MIQDRGPWPHEPSETGSLPDNKEGRDKGHEHPAASTTGDNAVSTIEEAGMAQCEAYTERYKDDGHGGRVRTRCTRRAVIDISVERGSGATRRFSLCAQHDLMRKRTGFVPIGPRSR